MHFLRKSLFLLGYNTIDVNEIYNNKIVLSYKIVRYFIWNTLKYVSANNKKYVLLFLIFLKLYTVFPFTFYLIHIDIHFTKVQNIIISIFCSEYSSEKQKYNNCM